MPLAGGQENTRELSSQVAPPEVLNVTFPAVRYTITPLPLTEAIRARVPSERHSNVVRLLSGFVNRTDEAEVTPNPQEVCMV